uniref:Uncharacterized protein n=1 Tax=Rousettus aegyptiacus TaxID=9407 RepID=A0A7J8F025_ROUAE|nr:hypothetical protein HJG63_012211 [Rousettus aegyptiacus]
MKSGRAWAPVTVLSASQKGVKASWLKARSLLEPSGLAAFVAICPCVSISLFPLSLIKLHRAFPVGNDGAIGVVRSLPERKVTNRQLLKLRELVPFNAFILSCSNRLGGTRGITCLLSLTPSRLI